MRSGAQRFLLASAVLLAAGQASAAAVECAEDQRTEALFCYAPKEISERDGIRRAPLYMGGPAGVRKTAFTIAANCATGVLHLKDRDGVSFGGAGPGEGTEHSRKLRQYFCASALPKKR